MANEPQSRQQPNPDYRVNPFHPRSGFLRRKVIYTWLMLICWASFTFGFQFLLVQVQGTPDGDSLLTETIVFGFPLHYWFSGQFLIVWFILLCILFNRFVDHLTQIYRKRK